MPIVASSETILARTVDRWLSELFAPEQREAVAESIAGMGAGTDQRPARSDVELADVERRIERLVDAVEAGTLDGVEVG